MNNDECSKYDKYYSGLALRVSGKTTIVLSGATMMVSGKDIKGTPKGMSKGVSKAGLWENHFPGRSGKKSRKVWESPEDVRNKVGNFFSWLSVF